MQPCEQVENITEIKEAVAVLKASEEDGKQWRTRMEDKVDKMLWFVMGFFGTAILTLIGFIVTLVA